MNHLDVKKSILVSTREGEIKKDTSAAEQNVGKIKQAI